MTRRRNRKSPSFPKPGERQQLFTRKNSGPLGHTRALGYLGADFPSLLSSFKRGYRAWPSSPVSSDRAVLGKSAILICVLDSLCPVSVSSYFCHQMIADTPSIGTPLCPSSSVSVTFFCFLWSWFLLTQPSCLPSCCCSLLLICSSMK